MATVTKDKSLFIFKALGAIFLIGLAFLLYFNSEDQANPYNSKAYSTSQDLSLFKSRTAAPAVYWQQNHRTVSPKKYLHHVLYFNFWAHWCPPCVKEMPLLNSIYKDLGPKGFDLIFVDMDEGDDNVSEAKKFLGKLNISAETLFGQKDQFLKKINIQMLPYHMIIDSKGRVAAEFYGDIIHRHKKIKAMLTKLLAEAQASSD